MYKRRLLNGSSNAGLVSLAGGVGDGFARAGNNISTLGKSVAAKDEREAVRLAAEKEKTALRTANASLNKAVNPTMASKFDDTSLGLINLPAPKVKDGFVLKEGETRYDGDGKQIVSLPKATPAKQTSKTVIDSNDMVHVVYSDGTTQKTGIKSKDYWKGKSGGSAKTNAPAGYRFAGEFDIGDDLDYELATSGAYTTDKNGVRYVNIEKYNRLMNLGNTEIK